MSDRHKVNVGKFKTGDIVTGYNKGIFKIIDIQTGDNLASSGERHILVKYNPITQKEGKARVAWCSFWTRPALEYLQQEQQNLETKLAEVKNLIAILS